MTKITIATMLAAALFAGCAGADAPSTADTVRPQSREQATTPAPDQFAGARTALRTLADSVTERDSAKACSVFTRDAKLQIVERWSRYSATVATCEDALDMLSSALDEADRTQVASAAPANFNDPNRFRMRDGYVEFAGEGGKLIRVTEKGSLWLIDVHPGLTS